MITKLYCMFTQYYCFLDNNNMILKKSLSSHCIRRACRRYLSSGHSLLPLSYINGKAVDRITLSADVLRPLINPANGMFIAILYRIFWAVFTNAWIKRLFLYLHIVFMVGKTIGEFYDSSEDCVSAAVEGAVSAFHQWKCLTGFERGKFLKRVADIIRVRDIYVINILICYTLFRLLTHKMSVIESHH